MNSRFGFVSFLLVQAFNAMNDNVFRQTMIILVAYQFADDFGAYAKSMPSVFSILFILPFFLFSGYAGGLADKMPKHKLIQAIKAVELAVMAVAAFGFYFMNPWLLMIMLALMGTQSAWFGPVKYAVIPELVAAPKLVIANGWIEATTFVAILLGTFLASVLVLKEQGMLLIIGLTISLSVLGLLASFGLPKLAAPLNTSHKIPTLSPLRLMREGWQQQNLHAPMIGISWFWGAGMVFLTHLPIYAKTVLNDVEGVWLPYLLCGFSIGVACGAAGCALWVKYRGVAPRVGRVMAVFTLINLAIYLAPFIVSAAQLPYVAIGLLLLASASAGCYVVPLYARLQARPAADVRGQAVAASNVIIALAMIVSAVLSALWLSVGSLPLWLLLVGSGSYFVGKIIDKKEENWGE